MSSFQFNITLEQASKTNNANDSLSSGNLLSGISNKNTKKKRKIRSFQDFIDGSIKKPEEFIPKNPLSPEFHVTSTKNDNVEKLSLSKATSTVSNQRNSLSDLNVFSDTPIENFNLNSRILSTLKDKMNIHQFTHIQAQCMEPFLKSCNGINGKDIMLKSFTGSGKTLAYVIPLIQKLQQFSDKHRINRELGTLVLILAPTRELCIQIEKVFREVSQYLPFYVTGTIMGGENRKSEKARLRKGIHILVATPGRLHDHLQNTQSFKHENLQYIVLDEADRLLDLGFEKKINEIFDILKRSWMTEQQGILKENEQNLDGTDAGSIEGNAQKEQQQQQLMLKKRPQMMLISATLNSAVDRLSSILVDPVLIGFNSLTIGNPKNKALMADITGKGLMTTSEIRNDLASYADNTFTIPSSLKQYVVIVPCKLRLVTLLCFLRAKKSKTIVFLSCCDSVEFHYRLFKQSKLEINQEITEVVENQDDKLLPSSRELFMLHGNLEQKERTKIYFDFLKSTDGILFCTDVAARGLDLPGTEWIVLYDPPSEPKDYIHRIGRTARIGHEGNSLLFLQPHEDLYKDLLRQYNIEIHEISGEDLLERSALQFFPVIRRKRLTAMEATSILQIAMEQTVDGHSSLKELAVKAFKSSIKSYSTHSKATKYIFHVNNLHKGHLAKAFALKDKPSEFLSAKNGTNNNAGERMQGVFGDMNRKRKRKLSANEKLQLHKEFEKNRPIPILSGKQDIPTLMKNSLHFKKLNLLDMTNEFASGLPSHKSYSAKKTKH